ncbi:hypothetical protein ZWY2020_030590 [Hordeum vulgare]|nr:hypothetical protein ZWY2020_030590 [Hordeum vulgare]
MVLAAMVVAPPVTVRAAISCSAVYSTLMPCLQYVQQGGTPARAAAPASRTCWPRPTTAPTAAPSAAASRTSPTPPPAGARSPAPPRSRPSATSTSPTRSAPALTATRSTERTEAPWPVCVEVHVRVSSFVMNFRFTLFSPD